MNAIILIIKVYHGGRPLTDASVTASALDARLDAFAPCLPVCFIIACWCICHQGLSLARCWIFAVGIVVGRRVAVAIAGRLARIVLPIVYRVR